MADYYTQFSCMLDVQTEENALKALALWQSIEDTDEDIFCGADVEIDESNKSQLWICSDQEGWSGDPNSVAAFIKLISAKMKLTGNWGFAWSSSCSKLRVDEFGGGAMILNLETGEIVDEVDTFSWLLVNL